MLITRQSILSGTVRTKELDVTEEQLHAYMQDGALIQNAFPNLSADDREFIMTGITSEEWAQEFANLDDEFINDDDKEESDE
jgi:hypothetical protein